MIVVLCIVFELLVVSLHFENTKTREPVNVEIDKRPIESGSGEFGGGCRLSASFSLYPVSVVVIE